MAEEVAIFAALAQHTSSYRVKFKRKEFLELVEIAKPKIIYQTGRMHFFAFDGFVMYTFECKDSDFKQKFTYSGKLRELFFTSPFLQFFIIEEGLIASAAF